MNFQSLVCDGSLTMQQLQRRNFKCVEHCREQLYNEQRIAWISLKRLNTVHCLHVGIGHDMSGPSIWCTAYECLSQQTVAILWTRGY